VVIGSAATRDAASDCALSADFGAAAVTIGGATRDGGSERAVSLGFGAAAETVIGAGTRGSERAVSVDFGAVAIIGGDVGGFVVTRDGRSGRAGVTNDVAEGCTVLASEGSYGATAWLLTVGSIHQWKATAKTA
jgi:hypothetical protein